MLSAKIKVRKCPAARETNHLLKLNYDAYTEPNKDVYAIKLLVFVFPLNRVSIFGFGP